MELVPFDDRDGWIWWDGALVPWRDARLHVLSHGLHYASAVFEGERAYSGNIFRLGDHTRRLLNSARLLMFDIPWSANEIDAACRQVLAANGLTSRIVSVIEGHELYLRTRNPRYRVGIWAQAVIAAWNLGCGFWMLVYAVKVGG